MTFCSFISTTSIAIFYINKKTEGGPSDSAFHNVKVHFKTGSNIMWWGFENHVLSLEFRLYVGNLFFIYPTCWFYTFTHVCVKHLIPSLWWFLVYSRNVKTSEVENIEKLVGINFFFIQKHMLISSFDWSNTGVIP